MENKSFSLLLPNLFIGLCKGSRSLRPYSSEFCNKLGYKIFQFEASFPITSGRISAPDLIITSEKTNNTLIIEWTEAMSISDYKPDQLQRYSIINRRDLIEVLAIPPDSVNTFNTCVIVLPDALEIFEKHFDAEGYKFPLLQFERSTDLSELNKVHNEFEEPLTDKYFTKGIQLNRIPISYLPFSLDCIKKSELVWFIVKHLISILVRKKTSFNVEEFCSEYVSVWSVISDDKKKEIRRRTKEVLNALIRKPIGKQLLKRLPGQPPRWEILEIDVRKNMRSIKKALDLFIEEVKGMSSQADLPFPE